ncbi:MAG TPA: hypothetical protein VI248_10620 [Kineosporiaceae bacterium]
MDGDVGRGAHALVWELVPDRRADPDVARALDRGDALPGQLQARPLARHPELLASGPRARYAVLARPPPS